MDREDGTRKNEMRVGTDIKELQSLPVECKLAFQYQKAGWGLYSRRQGFVILEGNPEVGVLTLHVAGNKPGWGTIGSEP